MLALRAERIGRAPQTVTGSERSITMNRKSRGLKVLSLTFLAVAGLMAFMAAGAQAVWLENAKAIASNKLVAVSQHTEGLLDVPTKNLVIHCATVEGKDLLLVSGTNTATGELWYSSCKVLQNGVLMTECDKHLNPKGEVEGLLEPIKASGKAKLVEIAGKTQLLFEPLVAGGNFAQIKFDPACALPEINNVKGKLLALCLNTALGADNCLDEGLTHLLKQGEETNHQLTYGGEVANLLGILKAVLASDSPWCGHV